ncbi:hypothetical protein Tco_0562711 [Tanacetum coccineum]
MKKYCNGGDLPGVIRSGDMVYFESYEWYENLEDGELNDEALNYKAILEESMDIKEESSENTKVHHSISNDNAGTNNHNKTQENEGWFDEHKLMEDDDDDISDLEDYLIQKDPPYYVNKEEERSKERRCKLLGISYVKPPI